MKCHTITIANKLGVHARAAGHFVNVASQFKCEVTLIRDGQQVNGKSIMGIMMLALARGTEVKLCTDGVDEHEAIAALCELVTNRFGERE